MSRLILISLSLLLSFGSIAQSTNRYMVFFKDKTGTPYSISQPEEFLTLKAIERKGRSVTEEDLPVTPTYITGLQDNNAIVVGTTNWLNGALIELVDTDLSTISNLAFVDHVEYVAPGGKPSVGGRRSIEEGVEGTEGSDEVLIQHSLLSADMMHADGYYGEGILVAVLDGGFINVDQISYFSHLYDNQQIQDIHNFATNGADVYDYSDHGTRVFSTMSASGTDYEGVAPSADYLLYVTEASGEYRVEEYNWLLAAERADSIGADIITTSVGYTDFDDPSMDYTHDDLDGETAIVTIAAEKAFERGIVVVSSAGNFGNKTWVKVSPPSDGEHVLAIGSVSGGETISNFSSLGDIVAGWIKPDLMAMGQQTVLIGQAGSLTTSTGTSFAAPQVAGLIAGIWEKYSDLSNVEIVDMIKSSADRAGNPDDSYGYGIPSYTAFSNIYEDVTSTIGGELQSESLRIFPNPVVDDILQISVNNPNIIDEIGLVIYTADGKKILETKKAVTWATNPVQMSMSTLSKGIYIIKIITTEQIVTKRVVKQ